MTRRPFLRLATLALTVGPFAVATSLAGKGDRVDSPAAVAASADAATAAKLMFGEGLHIEAHGDTVAIAYDPSSGLDDARVGQLFATYIRPAVQQAIPSYIYMNDFQVQMVDYTGAKKAGGEAFYLMEPALRGWVCVQIAGLITDGTTRKQVQDWCAWTAARTARYSMHEFRGQPVEDKVTGLYDGTMKPEDPLPTTGFVLVVPGVEQPIDIHPMRVQQKMLESIASDNQYAGDARKLHDENQVWVTKQKARVAALQKKQGGKGRKIVFGTRFFSDLDPVPAVKTVDSCEHVYWEGYATPKVKPETLFNWEMLVDGAVCKSDWFQGIWDVAGGPFFDGFNGGGCTSATQVPGAHTLSVRIWSIKSVKTGSKVVTWNEDGSAQVSDQATDLRDKVIAKGSIQCTTPDGLVAP